MPQLYYRHNEFKSGFIMHTDFINSFKDTLEEGKTRSVWRRDYIGASDIGQTCDAALGFTLREFPGNPFPPHLLRIFELGHKIEDIVVSDIMATLEKDQDFIFEPVDPKTGRQWDHRMFGGHFVCHPDGRIRFPDGRQWMVEIKSMNEKKWEDCDRRGVAMSHPSYYDQMQTQMGMSGSSATLFVSYNKNTSAYVVQVIDFDLIHYSSLLARVEIAMDGQQSMKKSPSKKGWCNWCSKSEACWEGSIPDTKRCQNCQHASAQKDGDWWCLKHETKANDVCSSHTWWEPKRKS